MRETMFRIGVFICLFSVASRAQAPHDQTTTNGWNNGRYWLGLDNNAKVAFLNGVQGGIDLVATEFGAQSSQADYDRIGALRDRISAPQGINVRDIAGVVDFFYRDKANLSIPVAYAFTFAARKLSREDPATLNDYIATLRQYWGRF